MYQCEECRHIFEEEEKATWQEPHGETLTGCPICFSAYKEIKACVLCDENLHNNEIKFCNQCRTHYKKHFQDLMSKTYSKEERELINIIFDGEEL